MVDRLSGGDAPRALRLRVARSLRWLGDVDRRCRWTARLAGADVVILDGPLVGSTLAGLVASVDARREAAADDRAGPRAGRSARATRSGPAPRSTSTAPSPAPGAGPPSQVTPPHAEVGRSGPRAVRAGPPPHRPTAPGSARSPDALALPGRAATGTLRQLAGRVPPPAGDGAGATRRGAAGHTGRGGAGIPTRGHRPGGRRVPPPSGDGAESWLRGRAEAAASRMGAPGTGAGSAPPALVEALAGAARHRSRGPSAPPRLLRPASSSDSGGARGRRIASDGAGAGGPAPPGDATGGRTGSRSGGLANAPPSPRHEARPRATAPVPPAPGPPASAVGRPAAGLPGPPPMPDTTALREPTPFGEFPEARRRAEPPTAGTHGAGSAPASGEPPAPWDFERAMKRVLDDAARRHGIEV